MACYAKNEEQVESFSCTACVCRFSSHTILASTGMSRTHAFLPLGCHRYVPSVVFLTYACEPRAIHGKWAGAFGKRLPVLGHGKPRRRNPTGQHLILTTSRRRETVCIQFRHPKPRLYNIPRSRCSSLSCHTVFPEQEHTVLSSANQCQQSQCRIKPLCGKI